MIRSIFILALVISASSILAACINQNPAVPGGQMDQAESIPADTSQDANDPNLGMLEDTVSVEPLEITMDTGEFFFAPAVITASPGQAVSITLTNTAGQMPHDFVIDELDVASEQIMNGEQTVVTFVVPENAAGEEYEFYCSVGDHRANGMVGTLTILPQ